MTVELPIYDPSIRDIFNPDTKVKPNEGPGRHSIPIPDLDTENFILWKLTHVIRQIQIYNLQSGLILLLLGEGLWDQLFAIMYSRRMIQSYGEGGMIGFMGVNLARGTGIPSGVIIPVFHAERSVYLSHYKLDLGC